MKKNPALRIKQVDLAALLSITPIHLNAVLRGRARPSSQLALRIEKATGGAVTVMELLFPKQKIEGRPKAQARQHNQRPSI